MLRASPPPPRTPRTAPLPACPLLHMPGPAVPGIPSFMEVVPASETSTFVWNPEVDVSSKATAPLRLAALAPAAACPVEHWVHPSARRAARLGSACPLADSSPMNWRRAAVVARRLQGTPPTPCVRVCGLQVCEQQKLSDWTGLDSLISPCVCALTMLAVWLIEYMRPQW